MESERYRISSYKTRGYNFFYKAFKCGYYQNAGIIRGRVLYEEIRYICFEWSRIVNKEAKFIYQGVLTTKSLEDREFIQICQQNLVLFCTIFNDLLAQGSCINDVRFQGGAHWKVRIRHQGGGGGGSLNDPPKSDIINGCSLTKENFWA